jgi:streptomycin 6-kinase
MSFDQILVPAGLVASQVKYRGDVGLEWTAALPRQAADFLDRWELRLDGPSWHGVASLALPVRQADGTPAVLKLSLPDDDHPGEASALRAWNGDGAVRLLREDPESWTLLLERLDASRDLSTVADDLAAVQVIGELLARLTSHQAPADIQLLADVAGRMVAAAPAAATALDADDARRLRRWAHLVREVLPDSGNRLLHWDLHYFNVLAADRADWIAIDPKPLAGDPGFDLLPALHNRWEELAATGDPQRGVLRRFDLLVEILGLDRSRAAAWSYGRILQNCLWDIEDARLPLNPIQLAIAEALERRV